MAGPLEPVRGTAGACLPAGAAAATADVWVAQACAVQLDGEGHVLTQLPELLAAAMRRLVGAAADADAALFPAGRRFVPTRLHGCREPGISLEAYAERLLRYCKCSPVCFVAAFAYMSRLQRGAGGCRGGAVRVDSLTAHRLMAVGLVVALKFYDDKYYSNGHYAQVAGVTLPDFNSMELDLLFRLDFRARVGTTELAEALAEMQALAGGYAGHSALLACASGAGAGGFGFAGQAGCWRAAAAAAAAAGQLASAAQAAALMPPPAAGPALMEDASSEGSCSVSEASTALGPLGAGSREGSVRGEELAACAASAPAPAAAAFASVFVPAPGYQPATAAAALLPWAAEAAAAAAAAAAAQGEDAVCRCAPPRRSKKRCSMEATEGYLLRGGHHAERQRLMAEHVCQG